MEKLLFSMIVSCLVFLSVGVYADATQQAAPGSAGFTGALSHENQVNPSKNNNQTYINPGPGINTGGIGPATMPTNVNQNGTVDTTPAKINQTSH